jgi:1,2-diacylglycerol 3-beta-galactosyltransferase
MSDTGGGHRASAEALTAGFAARHGGEFEVRSVDMWAAHTPWPFSQLPKSYSFLVRHALLWRLSYYTQQPRCVHRSTQRAVGAWVAARVGAAFDGWDPDLVVSVHPLMQLVPLRVLRARAAARGEAPAPFATVVTDLTTCHNTWFDPAVDACFVPTEECAARARRMGLREDQIRVRGLPIRPAFSGKRPAKASVRRELGLDPKAPTILLVGGGEGMGSIEATVDAIADDPPPCTRHTQVVAICGRNAALAGRLLAKPYPAGISVVPQGFVRNMDAWMAAADVVVTKAGPGTIAEATVSGLPMLLTGFIPCQEAGNVPFVTGRGLGAFERDPVKAARILARWLAPSEAGGRSKGFSTQFEAMRARVAAVGKPWGEALAAIVDELAGLARASGRTADRARAHANAAAGEWGGGGAVRA